MATDLIHPITGKLNVPDICARAEKIRDRLIDEQSLLRTDNPRLRSGFDARLTCFSKLQNVLGSFQLGCAFWSMNLLSPNWWKTSTTYPESEQPILRSEFQAFLKLGLVHLSFSAIESSLRVLMRAIDPSAHAGATVEFKKIYYDLLLHRLSSPRPDFIELLDMASKLRNTVHNNGVYFYRSGNDVDQPYRGQMYRFTHGKPVEFGNWPLLLEIISDLVSMLADIVHDPVVIGIGAEISDPAS